MVHETAEMVEMAEGFIAQEIQRRRWIYSIIDGNQEREHVRFDCADFVVLPDVGAQNNERVINWLVIFKDLGLRSVRDLRGVHQPLLMRVQETVQRLFPKDDTMLYFHSPPSVWQLHLHVAYPCDVLRTTNDMQRVQFLRDVISNLEIDAEYYRKATMTYVLPTGHELLKAYHPAPSSSEEDVFPAAIPERSV